MPISIMYQPIMGWLIMTMDWKYTVLGFVYSPWRLYMVLSSLINIFAYCIFVCLPESPKFMLAMGKPKEALEILIIGYKANGGKEVRKSINYNLSITKDSVEALSSYSNFTRINWLEFSGCSWSRRSCKNGVEANMATVQTTISRQHISAMLFNFCVIFCGPWSLYVVSTDSSFVLSKYASTNNNMWSSCISLGEKGIWTD